MILFSIQVLVPSHIQQAAEITSDKNLTLTYQAANGDTFTETIVIDHDLSHASIYESELNVVENQALPLLFTI